MNGGYHDEIVTEYTLRLREILKSQPQFVKEFFRGIADRTTIRTRLGYAYDINTFLSFLTSEIDSFKKEVREFTLDDMEVITVEYIEEYMAFLDYYIKDNEKKGQIAYRNKEKGKSRKLSSIKTLYIYFIKKGRVKSNPVELMEYPKIKEKSIVRLEYNEIAKLLDTVESGDGLTETQKRYHEYTKARDVAIITLLLGTGIRVSECAGLDIKHIDFENGGIKIIRKGGHEAVVYFGEEVLEALNNYLDIREFMNPQRGFEDALFLSMQKRRLDIRSIQNLVKKYASVVTTFKNISPHKLRSTYGTNLYYETGDIYLVADVLGHKSVETTKRHYADMSDSNRKKAARVIRLRKEDL